MRFVRRSRVSSPVSHLVSWTLHPCKPKERLVNYLGVPDYFIYDLTTSTHVHRKTHGRRKKKTFVPVPLGTRVTYTEDRPLLTTSLLHPHTGKGTDTSADHRRK